MLPNEPLQPLVQLWTEKIRHGIEHRWESFGKWAKECQKFYDGPHDFVFEDMAEANHSGFVLNDPRQVRRPTFGVTINKAAELEQLFVPIIYDRNPVPDIRPRGMVQFDPFELGPLGMMLGPQIDQERMGRGAAQEIKAKLLEEYLIYTADELDLRQQGQLMASEAVVKGRGLLWTEVFQPQSGGPRLVGAFHETVDRLVIDPDRGMRDATWVARLRVQTWWEAEARFGYPRGYLKRYCTRESFGAQAKNLLDQHYKSKKQLGMTNDLIVYWDVYSKMGIGDRLQQAGGSGESISTAHLDGVFDEYLGDYVYLAVCENVPHFLNMPPELLEMPADAFLVEQLQGRLAWPTPYWGDGTWPFVEFDPHPHWNEAWPTSHLRPALGELRFMDWVASCLMDKVLHSSREFIAILKSAEETLKSQIEAGKPLTILEISEMGKTIQETVQFLQHPPMNKDIMEVFTLISGLFDKRTGLTEIAYGTSDRQIRSASEAQIKENARNVRPGDMAAKLEATMRRVYKQLAITARWHLTGQADIAPIFGPTMGQLWDTFIASADVNEIVREFDYRIEAGSARKPNRETDRENMQLAMQIILPIAWQAAQATGNVGLVNQLFYDWSKAQELDPTKYQVGQLINPAMLQPQVEPAEPQAAA